MSYTPSELIAALDRHGVQVTERRLTDWREKGILPPLKKIGLGRGRGTRQFWENDDVLHQAIAAVFFLSRKSCINDALNKFLWWFKRVGQKGSTETRSVRGNSDVSEKALKIGFLILQKPRTRYALSRLWLAGFEGSTELGKETWLEYIEQCKKFVEKTNRRPGSFEGFLSFELEKSTKIQLFDNETELLIDDLLMDFYGLVYDQQIEFNSGERSKLITDYLNLPLNRKGKVRFRLAVLLMYEAVGSFSIENLSQKIAKTDAVNLKRSSAVTNKIRGIITKFLIKFGPQGSVIEHVGIATLITSYISPVFILEALSRQKNNSGEILETSISIIDKSLNNIAKTDIIRTDEGQFSLSPHGKRILAILGDNLGELWMASGFDVRQWITEFEKLLNPN